MCENISIPNKKQITVGDCQDSQIHHQRYVGLHVPYYQGDHTPWWGGEAGGGGRSMTDRSFRNQAALDPMLRRNMLLADFQASTKLGHDVGPGTYTVLLFI